MSTTILKKKADAIFSTYIRLKYADENLDVQCFTCDKVLPYKKIQNGHFYSRGILSLRYDEQNCRPHDQENHLYQINPSSHQYWYVLFHDDNDR